MDKQAIIFGGLGEISYHASFTKLFLEDHFVFQVDGAVSRFTKCEWGEISDEGKALNDEAALDGGALVAFYQVDDLPFEYLYIETRADRSETYISSLEEVSNRLLIDTERNPHNYDAQDSLKRIKRALP